MTPIKRPSMLFLFPSSMRSVLADVEAGVAPSELMYGVIELRARGYRVAIADHRFEDSFARVRIPLRRYGVFLIDWRTIVAIWRHDVIVVKDNLSLTTTVVVKLLRKRLIYVDSMFELPRRRWRKALMRKSLTRADAVVAYSKSQIALWSQYFGVPASTFTFVPYTMDTEFYRAVRPQHDAAPFVLAIGRDLGRDFFTLVAAVKQAGLHLKLVTLPYLLPANARGVNFIEVLQYVSYGELFQLYANAAVVVVPLKASITYPSGIRAVFESALLGKATIATRTPVLEEYLGDQEIVYVPPRDVAALESAISKLIGDSARATELGANARRRLADRLDMSVLADGLIRLSDAPTRRA